MFLPEAKIHHHVANTYDDVICQSGRMPHMINLTKKLPIIAEACSNLQGKRGWYPEATAGCPLQQGDHTGNAMENGRYRRDGEPVVCRSRLTGLCFFTFLIMNNPTCCSYYSLGTTGTEVNFLFQETSGFPSSGLLAGQTASFHNCASCKTLLPDAKTTRYNAGGSGLQGVPETWRQYRLFTNHYN